MNTTDTRIKPDLDAALSFIRDLPGKQIYLNAKHPINDDEAMHGRLFKKSDEKAIRDWLEAMSAAGRNIWFLVNGLGREPQATKANEKEIGAVLMYHVDADVDKTISDPVRFELAKADLLEKIRHYQPTPSYVVDSGNGYGVFWVLESPVLVTPENFAELKGRNIRLADDFDGDHCEDLCRIMRLPGTVNHPTKAKLERGCKTVLAKLVDDNFGIVGGLPAECIQPSPLRSNGPPDEEAPPFSPEPFDLGKLAPALRDEIVKGPAKKYPSSSEYRFSVSAALRRDGFSDDNIAWVNLNPEFAVSEHTLKQKDHDRAVSRLIAELNKRGIVAANADEDFASEPLLSDEDRVKAERAKKEVPVFKEIRDKWVYSEDLVRFISREDGRMLTMQAFGNKYADRIYVKGNPMSISTNLLKRPGAISKFTGVVFMPGESENYRGNFNYWIPSQIKPKQGNTKLWDDHLKYLFWDETQRNAGLDWLAWVYQNQQKHPNHALVMQGEIQGTGKSWISLVLDKLLNSGSAVARLGQRAMLADHNDQLLHTKLVLIEVRSGDKNLTNILHDMIVSPTTHVDGKGLPPIDIPNVLAFILEMNSRRGMQGLDNSDRRYLILSTDDASGRKLLQPKEPAYYIKLYGALDDPDLLAAIAYQLKNRDLKGYSGAGRAPDTTAKRTIMGESASALEQYIVDHSEALPWSNNLITMEEAVVAVPDYIRRSSPNIWADIADVLRKHMAGEKVGRVWLPKGPHRNERECVSLWALHYDGPVNMTPTQIATAYDAQPRKEKEENEDDIDDL